MADRNRSISRNPAILSALVVNSRAHLKRLSRNKRSVPAARALEACLDDVLERIDVFPARFNVSEQGLFVLGYHHQRAWDRRQREAAAAAKRARDAGNGSITDPGSVTDISALGLQPSES